MQTSDPENCQLDRKEALRKICRTFRATPRLLLKEVLKDAVMRDKGGGDFKGRPEIQEAVVNK